MTIPENILIASGIALKKVINWDAIKEIQNIIEEDNPDISQVKILFFCEIGC